MLSRDQGIPWWGKLALYGGIAVGGLWILSTALTNIFLGPINTYKDMWKQQYDALVKKMATYTVANPDGWTTTQQENVTQEEKILDTTTAGLADAAKGLYDMASTIAVSIAIVGVSGAIIWKVLNRYLTNSGGQARTAAGAGYIAICSFATHLAENGYPLYATRLITTSQTMFETVDAPYMQQTMSAVQAQIPYLTGIQLIVAQQTVEALSIEMVAIRSLLAIAPIL